MDDLDWLDPWRGKRVLVTGATGFVGRHVVELGARAGVEILAQSTRGICGDFPASVPLVKADLRDQERVATVVRDFLPDGIIHLAAAGVTFGSDDLSEMIAVNTVGLASLLGTAATIAPRPHTVVASTCVEYAPQDRPIRETDPLAPYSPYGVSKVAATLVAEYEAKRLPITLLRMFHIYGDGEPESRLNPSIIASAKRGAPVELTGCEQVRDYTYVLDAAEGFWRALTRPPEVGGLRVLNLGSGRAVTLRHLVEQLREALAARGHRPELRFGVKPYRPGEPMMYVADVTQACRVLEWAPTTRLEDGIRRMVEAAL